MKQAEHNHVRELNTALKLEEQRLSEHRSALEIEKTSMIAEQNKAQFLFFFFFFIIIIII